MSDNPKHPEIIDYGGRRRKFDRWLNPERPTVPECRSRRQRRSGYDRRTIKNNARFKIELERRSNFVQLKKMIPEEEKVADEEMILIDNTDDSAPVY